MKHQKWLRRILLAMVALAGTMVQAKDYNITFLKPSVVAGQELDAGEYKVSVVNDKMVIHNDRVSVESAVKSVASDKKYSTTAIRYELKGDKYEILEIQVGGTTTKLVVAAAKGAPGF